MKLHTATLEAELLHKAKLEDDFNRDLDIAFGKLTRETELERKLKEEERKLKEEAIFQKEEAIKLLYKNGIDPSVIASSLSIDLSEILNIVKWINKQIINFSSDETSHRDFLNYNRRISQPYFKNSRGPRWVKYYSHGWSPW